MFCIIDRIRLLAPEHEPAFLQWVQEVDYAACQELRSVQRFQVVRAAPGSDCDFFEIIEAESQEAFERDMATPTFAALVARFSQMARVSETFAGIPVPPGFQRHG